MPSNSTRILPSLTHGWGARIGTSEKPTLLPITPERLTNSANEPVSQKSISSSASFDIVVTGNLEKAEQTCELWAQAYPALRDAAYFLVGANLPDLGTV